MQGGDIAHPSIVLAKWLLSEFMVVKPSEACIVSMLKRACKASGGHAMVRVLDGGMMIWCVNMHPRLIFTLKRRVASKRPCPISSNESRYNGVCLQTKCPLCCWLCDDTRLNPLGGMSLPSLFNISSDGPDGYTKQLVGSCVAEPHYLPSHVVIASIDNYASGL